MISNLNQLVKKACFYISFFIFSYPVFSQQYVAGESLSDKYKFSKIKAIADDGHGGVVIARSYYGGVIMSLKGYYIEHYNKELELINEYKYAVDEVEVIDVFIADGYVTVLEVNYDKLRGAYVYWANRSPVDVMEFNRTKLFHFDRKKEKQINFLKSPTNTFGDNYYSQLLFDKDQSVFAITVDSKQKGKDLHQIYVFDKRLNKKAFYTFKEETETRHLVFENIAYNSDNSIYLLAKAYQKGKRTKAISAKYAYQLFKLKNETAIVSEFNGQDRYLSALNLITGPEKLRCVGFYSDSGNKKFRGLVYTEIDKNTLEVKMQKFNPFSKQFMLDKYGAEVDKEVKNLVFRDLHETDDGALIFNAEECYMKKVFRSESDSRTWVNRYHYNDIVCVKLNKSGDLEWARNINKAEATEGDEAYVSYSTAYNKENNCFFINSGAVPQQISKNRILFKRGYSRNPDVYRIDITNEGEMRYEQLINNKEVRLPVMVSKGTTSIQKDAIYFLARRGNRKQLVKVFL